MPSTTKSGKTVELELFKFDTCPFCKKVMKAVERIGVKGVVMRDIQKDPAAEKKLLDVGGMDQVPCLFIDGKPLYESDDIIEWLEAHFG